ncbi:hypothetical protein OBBRIDRAFT_188901 [Obba rivulosa]|uniref:Uncharacterized protein n=1 Tax=Obba rivulosa TaxID=1052685 RepID=A0A8E2AS29_9APHY|nr:hypothetical protein OBBRIDRAFT_188901 [Obba rivulosa]
MKEECDVHTRFTHIRSSLLPEYPPLPPSPVTSNPPSAEDPDNAMSRIPRPPTRRLPPTSTTTVYEKRDRKIPIVNSAGLAMSDLKRDVHARPAAPKAMKISRGGHVSNSRRPLASAETASHEPTSEVRRQLNFIHAHEQTVDPPSKH